MSILVVTGDDVDARFTAYLLAQIDGDIAIAGSITAAQHHVARRAWAAIVLDTHLPDGDGLHFLRTLVQQEFEGAVLMLSASKALSLKVRALDEGADDYIVRPYEPAELLARVRAMTRRACRRASHVESGTMRVGLVQLNTNDLELILPGNRRTRLTPNEMRVLHYLMKHAQRVVDHQELSHLLFGMDSYTGHSNAVGVYIRRVRRKIEEDVSHPRYIITVRGNGYQFIVPEQTTVEANALTTPVAATPALPHRIGV